MFTDYTASPAGSPSAGGGATSADKTEYWTIGKLRKCYTDYLFSKRQEIDEQIDARRYYHGVQFTKEQIEVMRKRRQPPMTFNRISRKVDGVVGLIERLRQDPKAFPRTPQHSEGADLATAALRYVLDEQDWEAKSPLAASDGAIDGIGGLEVELIQGDQGDPEVGFKIVDMASFFYDPRSYEEDFADARFMGVGRWIDDDIARDMFPDADESAFSSDMELTNNTDREMRWFQSVGQQKRVRLIDLWYRHNGGWCYAIFSGGAVLAEGKSYLKDQKGKEFCKYVMFSGHVDHDGDRYGFVRNLKSAQDGINAKQSKMQHILNSKRLVISQNSVNDIEKVRAEYARPDGVIVVPGDVRESVLKDDQTFDFAGMDKMLERNIAELENFGPNQSLIGQGLESQSGRAIQLLQQAGMAELGPYMIAYRGWKIRVYRALWNALKNTWKAERWIRVTDNQGLAEFVQINGMQIDPQTGQPQLVNAIGQLDVDIILDEGPDHVNGMADVYETLSNIVPAIAPMLSPGKATAVVDMLIETSPLPAEMKKKFADQSQAEAQQPPPPDPAVEAAQVKSQIAAQEAQQSMALEQQKAQHDAAVKQQQMEQDAMLKARQAEHAMALAERKAEHDAMIKARQCEADLGIEREKAAIQSELRREDHDLKNSEAQLKFDLDCQSASMEGKSADEKVTALRSIADSRATKSNSESQAFKSIAQSFKDGMEELAKSLSGAKQVKITRDKTGRVAGATVE